MINSIAARPFVEINPTLFRARNTSRNNHACQSYRCRARRGHERINRTGLTRARARDAVGRAQKREIERSRHSRRAFRHHRRSRGFPNTFTVNEMFAPSFRYDIRIQSEISLTMSRKMFNEAITRNCRAQLPLFSFHHFHN